MPTSQLHLLDLTQEFPTFLFIDDWLKLVPDEGVIILDSPKFIP
jgi:hypothetical protein